VVIVLFGLSGAGTSTVGARLADRLGWAFVDAGAQAARVTADSPVDVPRMDSDGGRWLSKLHDAAARAVDRRESFVLACSALTVSQRAQLSEGLRLLRFVYLKTPVSVLRERLSNRPGRAAKMRMLDVQLAQLEEPGDEALTLDGTADPDTIVGHILLEFGT
jgi:gluconokinase